MSDFSADEVTAVYRAIHARRDMRHFSGGSVDADTLTRLLEAAHAGPSVGYMQPWRFVRVTDAALREQLHAHATQEQQRTADACGERAEQVQSLKLQGILDCAEVLVVALCAGRENYVLGRRTLPEMDLCSTACAIQNLWLAARAEGLGVGWVSLFDADVVASMLQMPAGAAPIAILCIGPVPAFYDKPMLEAEGWDQRRPLSALVSDNRWPDEEVPTP